MTWLPLPHVITALQCRTRPMVNESNKRMEFYIMNNILFTRLGQKQKVFNVEKGSTLKMLLSFDHMVEGILVDS